MLSRLARPNGTNVATIYRNLSTLTAARTKQSRYYHILQTHQTPAIAAIGLRYASNSLNSLPPIPEAPPIPPPVSETIEQIASAVNALGEPTLASIGLGSYWPAGLVQHALEFLHVGVGLPWWGAITASTIIIRCCLFPLVIMSQRNSAKMHNHTPKMTKLHAKITEARQSGDILEAARYSHELTRYMKEANISPFRSMIPMFAQLPIFLSFFWGLRGMASAPVESMQTGGLFWFSDLTMSDPYYALPVITCITLYAAIELGTDAARLSTQTSPIMKNVLRAVPLVVLAFTFKFPAALLWYWTCSNFISLGQVGLLRIPAVRDYFKIDRFVKHSVEDVPKKGFKESFKDTWTNMKIAREIEARKEANRINFERAGKGPLVKTYKYDPTKLTQKPSIAMETKKRAKN